MGWYYGFSTITRGPSYIVASLSLPLTMLFLVYMLSRGALLPYAIIGGFISMISSNALSSAGDAAFLRLELKIQDLFVASKISSTDYMIGIMLSYLVFSFPGLTIYAVLGYIYGIFNPISAIILVLVIICLIVSTTSISFIIAGFLSHIRNVWGITAILSIVLTIIPPIFYPYSYLPKYAIYLLAISPATPASVLMQGIIGLQPLQLSMAAILAFETVFYFILAKRFMHWREK
jgi:ABC-2 type transport system permease protein